MTTTTANGWAALAPSSRLLTTWLVPGSGRHPVQLRLRHGSAGFLLVHNAMWFDEEVERLDVDAILDDWGYASRPLRGGGGLSNHAGGLASDLNATRHGRGKATRATFTDKQIRAIRTHLALYNGCLDWGGNWPSHPGSTAVTDAMHFEIAPGHNLAAVEKVARELVASNARRVKAILEANPGQKKVILS